MESTHFINNQIIDEIQFDPDWRKWTAATSKSYMQWLAARRLKNAIAAKDRGHTISDETIAGLRRTLQESD